MAAPRSTNTIQRNWFLFNGESRQIVGTLERRRATSAELISSPHLRRPVGIPSILSPCRTRSRRSVPLRPCILFFRDFSRGLASRMRLPPSYPGLRLCRNRTYCRAKLRRFRAELPPEWVYPLQESRTSCSAQQRPRVPV